MPFLWLVLLVVLCGAPSARADEAAARARAEVDAFYTDPSKVPPFDDSVTALGAEDVAARVAASRHLEALLAALLDDDHAGRAPTKPSINFGGGPDRPGRELRGRIAEALRTGARTPEAVGVYEWLVAHERLREAQLVGAAGLAETRGAAADAVLERVVDGHPHGGVLVICLEAHAGRAGDGATPALRRLARHHRSIVRDAARALLAPRGHAVEPFEPAQALGAVRALVAPVASFALTAVPRHAPVVELTIDETARPDASWPWRVRGFLLDRSRRVLGETLQELSLADVRVMRTRVVPLADEVQRVVGLRSTVGVDSEISGYEVFLGAHLLARGDDAAAARVLLPLFDALDDDRLLLDVVREQWGWALLRSALERFAGARDYAGAAALARHVAERFPGFSNHALAAKLARELPARTDEFRTFANPTPDEWQALASSLTRAGKIRFLCERLRLLNCFQNKQPGGVRFDGPQHAEPEGLFNAAWCRRRGRTEVINPLVELGALELTLADIPALAPSLADGRTLPTVGFHRDFFPARSVYTVDGLVASMIDDLARQELCAPILRLEPAARREAIAGVVAWAEANAGKSEVELLLASLGRDQSWYRAERAARELVERGVTAAVPRILGYLERADTNDFNRESIFRACARLDGRQAVPAAERLLASAAPSVRIAAGEIVFRWGDRARGRRALASGLVEGAYSTLSPSTALVAVQALLETGAPEDLEVATFALERAYFYETWSTDRKELREAFGERGAAVYRFYLRMLAVKGEELRGKSFGEPVAHYFAEQAIREIDHGEADLAWPRDGSSDEKNEAVEGLIRWLEAEVARLDDR